MKNAKNEQKIRRIAIDGMLSAVCFALGLITIPIGDIRLTLASLAVAVCALLYGPIDACIVAMLGELINQMIKYGMTVTTPLWLLPPAVRGLLLGVAAVVLWRFGKLIERKPLIYYPVALAAAVITTLANTGVMYLDSVIFGYYYQGYLMAQFALRLITGVITAVIVTSVSIPTVIALKHAGFGKKVTKQ